MRANLQEKAEWAMHPGSGQRPRTDRGPLSGQKGDFGAQDSGNSLILPSARDFRDSFFFLSWNSRNFAALISITMLAVVKIAGQQFKVQKDQTLFVPRISGNAGDKVEFGEVLLSYSTTAAGDSLAVGKDVKAVIKAEIIEHLQGDKVIAFKMKRRKGFRKKHGHRTHYTKIRINEIA
jgi:large subunit ribosomal protein L21